MSTYRRHHVVHGLARREPEGVVVAAAEVAHLLHVAEHERHGAELRKAGARCAEVLARGAAVALHVEQRVAGPQL